MELPIVTPPDNREITRSIVSKDKFDPFSPSGFRTVPLPAPPTPHMAPPSSIAQHMEKE